MNKKRFIAGAVCPKCGAIDRMVIDMETDSRQCINCGFSEPRPTPPAPTEPATRVTRASARRVETPLEPVRLLDGDSDGDSPDS